jgi:mono/diheme cytochrome c family protein
VIEPAGTSGGGGLARRACAALVTAVALLVTFAGTRAQSPPTVDARPPTPGAPAADSESGRQVYAMYCTPCHGTTGNGDGPMAAMLDPKPARHSDRTHMRTLSDDYLFRIIKEGGPALGKSPMMTAWGGTLSDAQIRDLVAYIRALRK